jgi:hypothetical protein
MKNNYISKYGLLFLIIIFSFIIVLLCSLSNLERLLGIKFIYGCLIAFLALAFNLYNHNNLEIRKITAQLRAQNNKVNRKEKKYLKIINSLYSELRDDFRLIFFSLLLLFLNYLFKKTDLPGITWPFLEPWTKNNFVNFINLLILFSTFYALYDLFQTLLIINGREFLN